MKRTNYTSGAKWEDLVGYSRAVKVGNTIEVAGTTAVSNGEVVAKGSAFGQARAILNKIEAALVEAGSSMKDVVRTRIYVTDINNWEDIGKAHHIFFKDVKPACTMVEVAALIDPEMLLEIEATAMISE